MEDILLSPYFTLSLSFIVLYKWVLKSIYEFKWIHLGAVLSRFMFCVIYAVIVVYEPQAEQLRNAVRMGLNILFLDEVINWTLGTENMRVRFCTHFPKVCNFLAKVLNKGG